ncbi:MAG TPA: hypothetical protein VGD48_11660 [Kutzneria sp.]|jgi:hypothetical protein
MRVTAADPDVGSFLAQAEEGRYAPSSVRLSPQDVLLDNPTVCIQGDRVTQLVFPVRQ